MATEGGPEQPPLSPISRRAFFRELGSGLLKLGAVGTAIGSLGPGCGIDIYPDGECYVDGVYSDCYADYSDSGYYSDYSYSDYYDYSDYADYGDYSDGGYSDYGNYSDYYDYGDYYDYSDWYGYGRGR